MYPIHINSNNNMIHNNNHTMLYQSPNKKRLLGPNFTQPGPYDVICARGAMARDYDGNRRFRALVKSQQAAYSAAQCKYEKSKIVSHIVDTVRRASPQGGFVKCVNRKWYEVGDRAAKEKIGQTFRDLLHTQYSSSTKAKAKIRVQKRREQYQQDEQPNNNNNSVQGSSNWSVISMGSDNNGKTEEVLPVMPQPVAFISIPSTKMNQQSSSLAQPEQQQERDTSTGSTMSFVFHTLNKYLPIVSDDDDELEPLPISIQSNNNHNHNHNHHNSISHNTPIECHDSELGKAAILLEDDSLLGEDEFQDLLETIQSGL